MIRANLANAHIKGIPQKVNVYIFWVQDKNTVLHKLATEAGLSFFLHLIFEFSYSLLLPFRTEKGLVL